jgi:hypothetical protein
MSGQVVQLLQCKLGCDACLPLRILSAADEGCSEFFSSIITVAFLEPTVATPAVIQFFSHECITSECDVGQLSPADVPVFLNSLCDLNNNLNSDSIKNVWTHLLLRSDEWYAAAFDFAVVPAFGKFLRPCAASQRCYLVDDEARVPPAVVSALQSNGVASVEFSALVLSASATCPRWLKKVFLGQRGSELVIALRDAGQPGHFQDMGDCSTLRLFFFSELKQHGEEWGEASR